MLSESLVIGHASLVVGSWSLVKNPTDCGRGLTPLCRVCMVAQQNTTQRSLTEVVRMTATATSRVNLTVNGVAHDDEVESRLLLVHYLRDKLGLTGTHIGCDTSQCGACTVHLDGRAVKSCTVLAAAASGSTVTTIE